MILWRKQVSVALNLEEILRNMLSVVVLSFSYECMVRFAFDLAHLKRRNLEALTVENLPVINVNRTRVIVKSVKLTWITKQQNQTLSVKRSFSFEENPFASMNIVNRLRKQFCGWFSRQCFLLHSRQVEQPCFWRSFIYSDRFHHNPWWSYS